MLRLDRWALALASLASLVACGGSAGGGRPTTLGEEDRAGEGTTTEHVIVERMPDGSVRKTTVTKKVVPAPSPPARPADPYPSDPRVRYNVEQVNAYRATKKLPPLLYDASISRFATAGSSRLSKDHVAHAHFAENGKGAPGFGSRSAENQGDPGGVPSLDANPSVNGKKQIDVMLKLMFDEGPGGGHYDNMMNPKYRRIGVGLVDVGGRMYMTNDFSD